MAPPITMAFIAVSLDQVFIVSTSSHHVEGVACWVAAYTTACCADFHPKLYAWQARSSGRQLPRGPVSDSSEFVPIGDLRLK